MNGLEVGLQYYEVMNLPVGLLGDLIAVNLYRQSEDIRVKPTEQEAVDEFFEMLKYQ